MLYAIIDTMQVGTLQQLFPQTSFPSSGPPSDWLIENGCVEVREPGYNRSIEKLVSCAPYIVEGGYVHCYTVELLTEDEQYLLQVPNLEKFKTELLGNSDFNSELSNSFYNSPVSAQIFISHLCFSAPVDLINLKIAVNNLFSKQFISNNTITWILHLAKECYLSKDVVTALTPSSYTINNG